MRFGATNAAGIVKVSPHRGRIKMAHILRHFVWLFLLSIFLLPNFLAASRACAAGAQLRLVILDIPYLDLEKCSTNCPNLTRHISTGATGLMRIPLTPAADKSGFLLQRFVEQISRQLSIPTIHIDEKRSLPQQSRPAAVIAGGDFIDIKAGTPKRFHSVIQPADNQKTNADFLLEYYRRCRKQSGILLITFPESLSRHPKQAGSSTQRMENTYDYLISRIAAETDFTKTLLMICSSRPPEKLAAGNSSLTPVVLKGLNFSSGILYAPSTRKAGIITMNDLRAVIRKCLNPETTAMLPVRNIPGEWRNLAYSQHALVANYMIRWPLLTIFGYVLIGVIFLFTVGVILRFPRRFIKLFAFSFLFLLTLPAALLLEALIDPLNWIAITVCTFLFSGIVFFVSYFVAGKNLAKTLLCIAVLTTGIMIGDGFINGYYEHKSFLGYSVVAGARYYGVGNEYMGILLGSYITAITLSLQKLTKWRKELLWFFTFFIGLLLMHPYFGADVGGGITALLGLGITNFLWLKQPVRIKEMAGLCLAVVLIFISMGVLDLYVYQSSMSHLGKLLLGVQKNGMEVFVHLVIRKIGLNLRLISSTPLTVVLIGVLGAIPLLYRFPPRPIGEFAVKYPVIISGLVGLAITALIGLLTNDSGIVSAAMTFLFGIGLIMVLMVTECFGEKGDESIFSTKDP